MPAGSSQPGSQGRGSRIDAAWAWLTGSPQRAALTALTAVGAIAAGVVLAIAINGARDAAATPSATPIAAATVAEATSTSTAGPSPTPSSTAVATPSPSATPTASPSTTPEVTSTPTPTPTPVATELRMTGRWERLPSAPNPDGLAASAAVRFEDGSIAVFHWERSSRGGDCVAVFSPDTETWTVPDVEGGTLEDGCFVTDDQFVSHPDGRLYSLARVVDPTEDPWRVDWSPWRDNEEELPDHIGSVGDGRLYGPLNYTPARLYELVIESGEIEQVSEYGGMRLDDIVGGVADRLFIGTTDNATGPSELVSYDPDTDDWRPEPAAPIRATWEFAAHGPDGWIYVPGTFRRLFDRGLWARDPDTGEWIQVELPDDLPSDWSPAFVDGGDGRLYAMDAQHPYVFIPDGVRPVPVP